MKISSYFNIHGIKVSEKKVEDELQLLDFRNSKQTERFLEYCKQMDRKWEQHINDILCIKTI